MQFSILATFAVLASSTFAWDKSSGTGITTPPTGTCYTITQTNSPACTASITLPDGCVTLMCLELRTITQSCGCDSIYTADECVTTCPSTKCPISYITVRPPCLTSPPYSYSNTTVTTTVTGITTLTTCPSTCTCSGQKTTWSGGNGPFTCTKKPSCTAQLPGGGTTTITGTTVVTRTGPTPTSSTGPTLLPGSSDGKKRSEIVSGGLLAGLLGMLAFL